MELERLEALAFSEATTGERERALRELLPGTDEHDFQWCLYHQLRGELDRVDAIVAAWEARESGSRRLEEIRQRQRLLRFDEDPERVCRELADALHLRLDDAPPRDGGAGRDPEWSSRLDAALISREAFLARALQQRPGLDGLTDAGLEWVATQRLPRERVRALLGRLSRPDVPGLVELVAADMDAFATAFGAHAIHRALSRAQLDALVTARPELATDPAFVETYLTRLAPDADDPWQHDDEAQARYLDRLLAFTRPLPPAFHSLKAHVLHHRLALDRRQGRYDRDLFLEYLAVPRTVGYAALETRGALSHSARLDQAFDTGLPHVGSDEALVRDYLAVFFLRGDAPAAFLEPIRGDYLDRLYAETMLLAGQGDAARFVEVLGPAVVEALRDRVDLELAPSTPSVFRGHDPVALEVDVKNVRTLVIKVFRIQALDALLRTGRDVELGIALDGLVANEERVETYDAPAMERVRRRIELPSLAGPGVYVVELIGNGKSTRALIRKGNLRSVRRTGAAGHVLKVIDEQGRLVPRASAWLGGREHRARDDGSIVIPFGAQPGRSPLVLTDGVVATLETFVHGGERYDLGVGFHVDREQQVGGRTAQLLVRPRLTVAGEPASLRLLERTRLVIAARDRHGAETSREVAIVPVDGQELVVPFTVPHDPVEVSFVLRASVRSLSEQRDVELEARHAIAVDELERTDRIEALHHAVAAEGHLLYVLGKTGEARPNRAVHIAFWHRFFTVPIELTLASDDEGRIELGALTDLRRFDATLDGGRAHFELEPPLCTWPSVVHAAAGDPIELPWVHGEGSAREHVSLLSRGGGRDDLADHARIERGALRIEDLPPGDHQLAIRATGRVVELRVGDGEVVQGLVVTPARILEHRRERPLLVREARVDGDTIALRIENATSTTRVHVFGTRFAPEPGASARLAPSPHRDLRSQPREPARSWYVSGRDIGDEARYVLERRHAAIYPGNLLPRPGLLLQPWAVRETTRDVQLAAAAGAFAPPPAAAPRGGDAAKRASKVTGELAAPLPSSVAFLAHGTATAFGLRPDAEGVVRIERAAFAHASIVRALVVDEHAAVEARILLSEVRTPHRDLRLADGLDPDVAVARREQRSLLRAGDVLALEPGGKARLYATLADAHALLATLADPTLRQFGFVARWSAMSEDQKNDHVDRFGCHELFLFIHAKDRDYFGRVIAPHLALKLEKTFLDEWLLEMDLERWREPARYERLNALERVLLARRISDERSATRRRLRDELEAQDRDLDADASLYQTMIAGSAPMVEAMPMEEGAYFDHEAEEPEPYEKDLELRSEVRRLYRAPDRTREWAETHYWKLRRSETGPERVPVSRFWLDAVEHDGEGPFLSASFAEAAGTFTAAMGALALLDLPFEAAPMETRDEAGRAVLRPGAPAIVIHEAVSSAPLAEGEPPLLISQGYLPADDTYRYDGTTRVEQSLRGEMITHAVYRCQVVIINPTSAPRELDVLLQIPAGSLPVANGFRTRGQTIRIEPHATHTFTYSFYFPEPGTFGHFPAHVTRGGQVVARAEPTRLEVARTHRQLDATSWAHVARHGSLDEVCASIGTAHVRELDPSAILWRLRERESYERIVAALEARRIVHTGVSAYALRHADRARIRSLLASVRPSPDVGLAFRSPVLDVVPVEDRGYEHLEYGPLIHARAHRLGARLRVLDDGLAAQYRRFLEVLTYLPALTGADRLAATYYLFAQDRIAEALEMFARVDPARAATRMQYDYLHVYACFFEERLDEARAIAEGYREHAVGRWRKRFLAVLEQLDASGAVIDDRDREQEHARLAAREPALDFTVEQGRLTIRYQAIERCELRIHRVDLELLFSQQPFLRDAGDRFSVVEPNRVMEIALPADAREHVFELPEELRRANAVLELRAAGVRRSQTHNASALDVQLVEPYGRLTVRERGAARPLSRAYVKVYARKRGGQVLFYKDGYTDLRGVFDYASLSNGELEGVERFALLVLSDAHGAELREASPPAR